jgi:transposase
MAAKVLAVAIQDEIKRLKNLGLKERAIARALRCSRNTVAKYLTNPVEGTPPIIDKISAEDDWQSRVEWEKLSVEAQLGTPVKVLWEELIEKAVISIEYPGFWKQFRKRFPNLPQSMHRVFAPGSRIEIDYCDGIDILNPINGEILSTQLFVGVLCHSRYVFAEFTFTQKSHDFLSSHVRMFEAFGGAAQVLSPDNLKSAVTKAHRYDPVINPAYKRLAEHYGVAVVPARVRTPKDKAIVERTIQIFQRWFYYRVRHRTFTSLVELNQALKEHLEVFHLRSHRTLRRSRQEMFESEKPSLIALPAKSYEVSTHHRAKPYSDCHLIFEKNYYSVPYLLRGQELDIWASPTIVEIYHNSERVALHSRRKAGAEGNYTTNNNHYPPGHQAYGETTPTQIREHATRIGVQTLQLIDSLMSGPHPLRYLRRAQGILGLSKKYGAENLEKACKKANTFAQTHFYWIEGILKRGRLESEDESTRPITRGSNPHLRGKELFH